MPGIVTVLAVFLCLLCSNIPTLSPTCEYLVLVLALMNFLCP